jgi:hypothetical protein
VSFVLLDQLSLPGDPAKPNEDALAHLDRAALVLDGATPLGPSLLPGPSDAAWVAQFGARRLAAHLKDGDGPDAALKHALADAEKSFAGLARHPIREKWQTPCASMMLAVETERLGRAPSPPRTRSVLAVGRGSRPSEPSAVAGPRASEGQRGIDFLWFGDCAAIVEQEAGIQLVGETMEKRQAEAARARKMARDLKLPAASGIDRTEIQPLLRAARNRINSKGNWLFSPDRRAAAHVARRNLTVDDGALLLIASDGFLALVSDYGAYDTAGLMAAARRKGLAALGEELRAIERDDALAEKFPRFKPSDDATAVLLRVG